MVSCEAYLTESKKSNSCEVRIFGIVLFFLSLFLSPASVFAGGIPQTELSYPLGSASALGNGDYISSNTGGLNTYFSYFIEVTPGLNSLRIDIFDADIGGANNDYQLGGSWNTAASYTLFDPKGLQRQTVFTIGDATNPAGANNAWLNFFTSGSGTGNYVRDNFSTAAYTNNDGNYNWAANWVETDAGGGGAGGGNIQITGGELRFNGATADNIYREVNLSGTGLNLASASLSFSYRTSNNLGDNDCVRIDVSGNGGGSYTTLQTFCNDVSGTATYDISSYIASNTRIRFYISNALEAGEYFYVDNVQIGDDAGAAIPGHWELRMNMSSAITGGDDVNGYAVRAHDGNSGAGGTEVNVYARSFYEPGVLGAGVTVVDHLYPYITSGCTFDSNDFDYDSSGSISFTSRTGAFTQNITTESGATVWANNVVTGWRTDIWAADYGIWSANLTVTGPGGSAGNLVSYYIGSDTAANPPPTAQPQANTFRMYLPTDAVAAPVKPFVTQTLAWRSGPNPPVAGSTTRVQVDVNVFNPTPWPITFSASNLVTANVPGGGAVYAGNATVSQGSITAQPGIGATGNITWNPGTVAAGATARLTYQVDVTPPGAGAVSVTGTPASNGTRGVYVDETCSGASPACSGGQLTNATYTFGPLCQLALTAGTNLPTLAVISSFDAYDDNGQMVVKWETASEVNTAGFYLLRLDEETGKYRQINKRLLPGLINSKQGGTYRLIDHGASLSESTSYKLIEIESRGKQRTYGPFTVGADIKPDGFKSLQKTDSTVLHKPEVLSEGTVSHYTRESHGISGAREARIAARKAAQIVSQSLQVAQVGEQAKIAVQEDGLYLLTSSGISAVLGIPELGIRNMIKNRQLSLSNQGQKVAYFSDNDSSGISFYGQGIDSIYTRKNIYWLKKEKGLEMRLAGGKGPSPAAGDETFTETLHFEEDHVDAPGIFTDPTADYWFWDYVVSGDPGMRSRTFTLRAQGVAPVSEAASLSIGLRGATEASVSQEHHAVFTLNGTKIGETLWEGNKADHAVTLSFSQDLLKGGDNTLEVRGSLDPGVPYSIFFINSFDVTYQRLYQAVGDALLFSGDTNQTVSVSGFTKPDIGVFEVTDPNRPTLIRATTIDGVAGNYRVSFTPTSGDAMYLAVSRDAIHSVGNMAASSPSRLKERNNSAEYLLITTSELKDASGSLAAYRGSQGLTTMVVNLENIMDEFNYGIYNPKAVRDFLSYAYQNWKKPPRYVVLAGDGTYDYKNNLGYGDSLIPPMMVATPDGLFPSDNYFVDMHGNHVPEIAIGRLPAGTSGELQSVIKKIITYETTPGGAWEKRIVMLADIPEDGGPFTDGSDYVASLLPPGYTPVKIYLSEHPLDEARWLLLNEINNGVGFTYYRGHGGVDRLSQGGLLLTSDVSSMTNTRKFPIFTAMTCVVGQFSLPGYDSLAEELVMKENGGAVAVWAPTGLSIDSEAAILDRAFYRNLFEKRRQLLGDVVVKSLKEYSSNGKELYMMDIYNLLGDPALRIRGN